MFVGDWAARGAAYWPTRVAAVDVAKGERGRFTYADLDDRAERLAHWLRREAGVGVGERVGLLAQNGVEYLDALFACGKLGAAFVPYNWRLHARENGALVARTAPKALLFDDACAAQAAGLGAAPGRRTVHLGGRALPGSVPYAEALGERPGAPVRHEPVDAERVFCLLFTGGTTGLPKAARISYRMAAWNALNTLVHEVRPGDVTVTHTPMFHTGGLFVYTLPLLTSGGRVVIMRTWDAGEMLRLAGGEKVSLFFCVPSQALDLAQHRDFAGADLASVRFVTTGGAPMPVPLLRAWQAAHPRVPFKQGFGMTECGPGIFSMGPEHAVEKAGSIGRPNYFVDARLVGDDGRPVPPGVEGELCLRGPSLCSGYFGVDEPFVDGEGWFRTGDLMRADADGFHYVVGRQKDMFISGGENVYPVEIEQALAEHPAVASCAVVGVPHEKWGEVGHAFVVVRPGRGAPAADELGAFLKGRLASYKVPKGFTALAEMPLTPAGKFDKNELRRRLAGRGDGGPR